MIEGNRATVRLCIYSHNRDAGLYLIDQGYRSVA